MNKLLIIGNWKCNPTTLAKAKQLFNSVKKGIKKIKNIEVVICPPFVYLSVLAASAKGYGGLRFGSQDCFWEDKGSFTGEISPAMLKDTGCEYVIIGHSERRKYQKETDEMINNKIKAALKAGLKVILCIEKIIQIKKDLKNIKKEQLKNLIIAYEPIFAIGTGKPCAVEKAKKMRNVIGNILKINPVLYGGSVNSQNANDYIEKAGFQGLLIGSASLNPKEFLAIVKNISKN
ncbi:MAG: triose-phosphate isomerase [bacterium]|nr:triose-phosphate isomerase [bacterium]